MSSEKTKPQTPPVIILRKKKSVTSTPQSPTPVTPDSSAPSFVRPTVAKPFSAPPRLGKTLPPGPPISRKAPPRGDAPPPRRARPAPKRAAAPVKPRQPPPTLAPGQPNRRQRDALAQQELLVQFRARWPQAFPLAWHEIKPLARGIHQELATHFPDTKLSLIKQTIARFQRNYDGAYWRAVLKGGPRHNLDGSPNGEVTVEEQEQAKKNLSVLKERKKAAAQPRQSTDASSKEGSAPAAL